MNRQTKADKLKKADANILLGSVLLLFLAAQIIYILFSNYDGGYGPDEERYLMIAQELINGQIPSTFQYPVVYPFMLMFGFITEHAYFDGVLRMINILVKTGSLYLLYVLFSRKLSRENALFGTAAIAFSGVYFVYSRRYMAENILIPLLLITVLFHICFRDVLVKSIPVWKKVLYTAAAAFLSLLVFETKYLCIVLFPVSCLFWGEAAFADIFRKDEKTSVMVRIRRFMGWEILYTATVCICIVLYAWYIAGGKGETLSLSVIKETMGFSVATGPDKVGYSFIPEFKWILAYSLYALMGASILMTNVMICDIKACGKKYGKELAYIFVVAAALVYVAARHSTLAGYNEGGIMIKILGRYVSVIGPLAAIALTYAMESTKKHYEPGFFRRILAAAAGGTMVVVPYLVLYKNVLQWHTTGGLMSGYQGFDMKGFFDYGRYSCLLYGIVITACSFIKNRFIRIILIICSCILNLIAAANTVVYY